MRKTLLFNFLLVFCFYLNAQQVNEGISINVKDAEVENVFEMIGTQAGKGITCDPEILKGAKKVTINVKNAQLHYVMDQLCKGQRFTYVIKEKRITLEAREGEPVISGPVKIIHLHGKVINQLQDPVADVTVTELVSHQVRRTNSLGEFYFDSIRVGSILKFTGNKIKTKTARVPENKTLLQIKVEDEIATMPAVEVVYTGYQNIFKKAGSGPNFVVGIESLQKRPSTNIVERLDGLIPALLPVTNKAAGVHQPTYFLIGGRTTLIASPDPLVVVDNFPFKGDLRCLNPDDIENISVLRDATAAGIWGAQSANGVVVITTKAAKLNRPFRASFNTFVNVTKKPDLFYADRMSAGDRITVDSLLFKKGYFDQFLNSPLHPALSPVAEAFYDQSLSEEGRRALFNVWRKQDNRSDMEKYFYRTGLSQHMSAQMSGSSSRNAYFISLGYDWARPELKLSKEHRYTLVAGNSYQPLPGLEIAAKLSYSKNEHLNTDGVPEIPMPYQMIKDSNGNVLFHAYKYRNTYTDTAGQGKLLNWKYSPMQEFERRNNTLLEEDTRVLASIKYQNFPGIFKGLEAAFYMQREIVKNGREDIYNKNSFFVRDLVNQFSQINDAAIERPVPWDNIIDLRGTKYTTDNYRFILNYNRKWEDQTALDLMAGRDEIKTKGKLFTERVYGKSSDKVDYKTVFPMYFFSLLKQPIPYLNTERSTSTTYFSNYFNGKFQWKGKYYLSASWRIDQSSLYGAATNNKKMPLYSTGLAWDISSEPFYKNTWVPILKLRASYGRSGNTPQNVTAIQTIRRAGNNQHGDPMIEFDNPPLSSLRWEKVNTLNVGLNFQAAGDRIEATVDWYSKRGKDLIGFRSLDPTSGNLSLTGNVASMASGNLDVILETKNICREFQWRTGLLFSFIKERVTHTEDKPVAAWMYCDPERFTVVPGKPLYGIYSFPFEGLDANGNPMGAGKNNDYASMLLNTGHNSLIFHGRSTPPVFGSLTNEFRWKQITLNVMMLYKLGYYFRRKSINYYSIFDGTSQGSADFANRWQKPGDENFKTVPGFPETSDLNRDLFYNYSQVLVERADHIRLQNIYLSFDLERNALKRLGLRTANIYCNWSNVGIIWRANEYKIDPDKLSGYPQPAIFTIGVRGTLK